MTSPGPNGFGIVETPLDGGSGGGSGRDWPFKSKLTRSLWQWWMKAGDGRVPTWSCFDITDHRSLAANIYLIQQVGDDFQLRLYGEEAIQIIGRNATGQVISPTDKGALSEHLHSYFTRVVTSGCGWTCSGSLLFVGREHRRFEAVDVPFIRYGSVPDTILGVIDLIG
jgi:hypothetical protein